MEVKKIKTTIILSKLQHKTQCLKLMPLSVLLTNKPTVSCIKFRRYKLHQPLQ